jgi:hypothetical protein
MSDALIATLGAFFGASFSGVLSALITSRVFARKARQESLAIEVDVLSRQIKSLRADLERALSLLREHGIDFHSGDILPACRPDKRLSI